MKNFKRSLLLMMMILVLYPKVAYAALGDLGFFGGITEGRKLPKSTELLMLQTEKNKKTTSYQMVYKEEIFLSGEPVVFEGLLSVKESSNKIEDEPIGTYTVTYVIEPSETTNPKVSLKRNIVFNVRYRKEANQIIKDYEVKSWAETIKTDKESFTLDPKQSEFGVSILEDHTAGVVYYKGNLSKRAVYKAGEGKTVEETDGTIYGYGSAWSTTEAHRINGLVTNNDWQMEYQVRPSVAVNKILQYGKNEPTAISFSGNYREVLQNSSGLQYNIFAKPQQFLNMQTEGSANIDTYNTFEQLIAPNLNYLKGHFAEDDIKKLFSMQILEGDTKHFKPEQAITRGQYITALTKAIKLPIKPVETKKTKKAELPVIYFPDVLPDRPDYPFINAAYEKRLAIGRTNGNFYADYSLERQEALVILLRAVGLENLGLDPTPVTSYTDDFDIGDWAKQEIYAATRIGLIKGDEEGRLRPNDYVSKAEAAALINNLITYMREDMQKDYTENIVHFAD